MTAAGCEAATCDVAWCERATLRRLPPAGLSEAERAPARRFADAGRSEAWRLGRELVKRLVPEGGSAEVLPDDSGRTSRPALWIGRRRSGRGVSISHTERSVAAAVCDGGAVGVDITDVRRVAPDGLRFWLTDAERDIVAASADPTTAAAAVWASKEAAYKAVNRGEAFRPARFIVTRITERHAELTDADTAATYRSEWRRSGTEVLAVVTVPSRRQT